MQAWAVDFNAVQFSPHRNMTTSNCKLTEASEAERVLSVQWRGNRRYQG